MYTFARLATSTAFKALPEWVYGHNYCLFVLAIYPWASCSEYPLHAYVLCAERQEAMR